MRTKAIVVLGAILPLALATMVTAFAAPSSSTTYTQAKAYYAADDYLNAFQAFVRYEQEDAAYLNAHPDDAKAIQDAIAYCLAQLRIQIGRGTSIDVITGMGRSISVYGTGILVVPDM